MMSIAPTLLLIFYVCAGPVDGSPRIYRYDAAPRKPGTWENPPPSPELAARAREEPRSAEPLTSDRRTADAAATMTPGESNPSIADPGRTAAETWLSRGSGTRKRSVESRASLLAPEKMLQTMVSMVSQRTSNDAWAADGADASVTSSERIQGGSR